MIEQWWRRRLEAILNSGNGRATKLYLAYYKEYIDIIYRALTSCDTPSV